MSGSTPEGGSNHLNAQSPPSSSSKDQTEDSDRDSTEVGSVIDRRRVQNRLAQRNHRRKVKEHISALEAQLVDNMILRSGLNNQQAPPSLASQSPNLLPTMDSPYLQSNTLQESPNSVDSPQTHHLNQPFDQILDFPLNFTENIEQAYSSLCRSETTPNPTVHGAYPPYPARNELLCGHCTLYPETQKPSNSSVTDEAFNSFPFGPPSSFSASDQSPPVLGLVTYEQAIDCYASPKVLLVMDPSQNLTPGSQPALGYQRSESDGTFPAVYHSPPNQPQLQSNLGPRSPSVPRYSGMVAIPNAVLSSHHYHHAPDDVYKVQQSSFSVVPRPTVRGLEVQKPQTYVLVPISEPYPQGSPMQEYRPHQFPYP